jgi:cytochrome c oxidase cbb3-type subunit 3
MPLVLLTTACDREERGLSGQPKAETLSRRDDPRAAEYAGNAYQISQGQRLFGWMNCTGCHAHGGGGMGPPLSDSEWRYGSGMEDIVRTILHGRPNGMPRFEGKITEQQAWQLAAYVRSLSGLSRKDAVGARPDAMMPNEPATLQERPEVQPENNLTGPQDEQD